MLWDRPIKKRAIEWNINPADNGQRVSNLSANQPETGKPNNWLKGITRSKVPSSASLMSRLSLMVGIRDAQVEKHKPVKKNKMLMTILCLVFNSKLFQNTLY
jgi:hypothetical protein